MIFQSIFVRICFKIEVMFASIQWAGLSINEGFSVILSKTIHVVNKVCTHSDISC